MAEHNITGINGEEIAIKHLTGKSCTIIEKNWRCGRLEVDIIAREGDRLIIAEVKTRTRGFLQSPGEAVNRRKQEFLIRAANAYIRKMNLDLEVRFDIITIIFSKKGDHTVQHIENAFYPAVRS